MKLSYNWLKDYLAIDLQPNELSILLTDIGLEVESVEQVQRVKGGMEGLVVGEVLSAEKHPEADKLTLTMVSIGGTEPLPIVCGAPNVAAGQKVVVATVGTTLYPMEGEPFVIKKAKIRGAASMGMICAEDEIGIGADHSGIIVLPSDTVVGTPAKEVFHLSDDYVYEIGLTANRSDATCHVGIAKDLYAALIIRPEYSRLGDIQVKMPDVSAFAVAENRLPIAVEVRDTAGCRRYVGVAIDNIQVAESPEWLQQRLQAVGIRAINNIVDITNYVLYELGQPLHAFDADRIAKHCVYVETLAQGTEFVGLDGHKRSLHTEDLMICDGNHSPMCIAGVFGGADSGVTDSTTRIFLESAYFDPKRTRRSSERHNLRTEAATRFEKGADPNIQSYALQRAALLICELAGGVIASNIIDIYPEKIEKRQVRLSYRNLQRLTGANLSPDEVRRIADALEMDVVAQDKDSLTLAIPTNKADVTRECDVIEEIIRIYGLNNITLPTTLHSITSHNEQPDRRVLFHRAADHLAANGYLEIMATSIANARYYADDDVRAVRLLKSLNADYDVLRQTLLFGGLEAIALNQNHRHSDLQLFEYGKVYAIDPKGSPENPHYVEENRLAIWLTGDTTQEHWRQKTRKADFYDLQAIVQQVLQCVGVSISSTAFIEEHAHLGYGLQWAVGKKIVATLGAVSKKWQQQFDVKNEVFFAEIAWDIVLQIAATQKKGYKPIVKYPTVRRDLSLLIDKSVRYDQILDIARKSAKQWLRSAELVDVYEDESKLGAGKKSYAVAFYLQDDTRTLTDTDIDKTMQKMLRDLEQQIGATLRQ